jgi:hypothetical protein
MLSLVPMVASGLEAEELPKDVLVEINLCKTLPKLFMHIVKSFLTLHFTVFSNTSVQVQVGV